MGLVETRGCSKPSVRRSPRRIAVVGDAERIREALAGLDVGDVVEVPAPD
jgi:hypothetical protein